MENFLDLRTVKNFTGANETPYMDSLLDNNLTLTGQEYSDNPILAGVQRFNKGLFGSALKTGEQGFNYAMATGMLPFAFTGDTAEGLYGLLPEEQQSNLSSLMYNSPEMDPADFGDAVEGHLMEGLLANPNLTGFVNRGNVKTKKDGKKTDVTEAIKYDLDDTKGLFLDESVPDNIKSGIIFEYDWYTKGKKWEGDKGNLWHGIKVDRDKQSKLENKFQEQIIAKQIIIGEGKTLRDKSLIKARLDDIDLEDLNKVWAEMGRDPLPKRTTFIDKDGNQIDAKFVAGTIDGNEINLMPNEIKRLAYILSDGIRSSHRQFDQNPNVMGLVDRTNNAFKKDGQKLVLGMRMDSAKQTPYSLAELDTLSHELGHLLHFQLAVDDIPTFLKGTEYSVGVATKEMVAVSKKMRPDLWDDAWIKQTSKTDDAFDKMLNAHQQRVNYRMKDVELLADFIKGYLTNPALTKELAPNMSKILKQMVNESWFKDILMLSKADILPPNNIDAGLLDTATV